MKKALSSAFVLALSLSVTSAQAGVSKSRSQAYVLASASTYTTTPSQGSGVRTFQAVVSSKSEVTAPNLVPLTFSSNPLATTTYKPSDHHELHALSANASVAVMGEEYYDTGNSYDQVGFFLIPDVDTGVGYELQLPPGAEWKWESMVRLNAKGDRLFVLYDSDEDNDLEVHTASVPRDGQLTDLDPIMPIMEALPENYDFRMVTAYHHADTTTLFFLYSTEDAEGANQRDMLLSWTEGDTTTTTYDLSSIIAEAIGNSTLPEMVSVDLDVLANGTGVVGEYTLDGENRGVPFVYTFDGTLQRLTVLPTNWRVTTVFANRDGTAVAAAAFVNGGGDFALLWDPAKGDSPDAYEELSYDDFWNVDSPLAQIRSESLQPGGYLTVKPEADSAAEMRFPVPGMAGETRLVYNNLFNRYGLNLAKARDEAAPVHLTIDGGYLVSDILTTQWPLRVKLNAANPAVKAAFPTLPTQYANGWNKSKWLGWFFADNFPWVWAPPHGWVYSKGEGADHWFLDTGLGWIYTGETYFPWIWQAETNRWIYNDKGRRWYFDPQRAAGDQWYRVPAQ